MIKLTTILQELKQFTLTPNEVYLLDGKRIKFVKKNDDDFIFHSINKTKITVIPFTYNELINLIQQGKLKKAKWSLTEIELGVTPEMLNKLWYEAYKNDAKRAIDLVREYGYESSPFYGAEWLETLDQKTLLKLYKELKQIKNGLNEIELDISFKLIPGQIYNIKLIENGESKWHKLKFDRQFDLEETVYSFTRIAPPFSSDRFKYSIPIFIKSNRMKELMMNKEIRKL